ncbi:MAG: helix-turn-helix transcriptional regulator [Cyclobacteriaceae bacterium]
MALIIGSAIGVIWVVEKFRDEVYLTLFGANLRKIRESKGLSQESLAAKANTTLSQVGRIERGLRAPTILTVVRLALALDTDPAILFDFRNDFEG